MSRANNQIKRIFSHWPEKAVCLVLATALFVFLRMVSFERREFEIPVEILLEDDYIVSTDFRKSIHVSLKGDQEIVNDITPDMITLSIDLTPFETPGAYSVPVVVSYKDDILNDLEVKVSPTQILVGFEKKLIKTLPVDPVISGSPIAGFKLTASSIFPSVISVVGPFSILSNYRSIQTEEIDLSDKKKGFELMVQLEKPNPLIVFAGGDLVEFHCTIEESIQVKTVSEMGIVSIDLKEDLILETLLPPAEITVQGSELTLSGLKEGDINIYIDCSSITSPGEYLLPVKIEPPAEMNVLMYSPSELLVKVRRKR